MAFFSAHFKSAKQENFTPLQRALRRALKHRTTCTPQLQRNPHGYSLLGRFV